MDNIRSAVSLLKNDKRKVKKLSREERLQERKEREMKALLFEVVFQVVFLVLLLLTAVNSRDQRAFGYKDGTLTALNITDVHKVTTIDNMWRWMERFLLPFVYPPRDWSGHNVTSHTGLVSNWASYKIGPLRIRQHRAKSGSCSEHPDVESLGVRCLPAWSSSHRDYEDYNPAWSQQHSQPNDTDDKDKKRSPWEYTGWWDVGGVPIVGELGYYPPGGYIVSLNQGVKEAKSTLKTLRSEHWLDDRSRVVVVEITLYSPNANLFAMVTGLFEFQQAGVIKGNLFLHAFRMFAYLGGYPVAKIIGDLLVYGALLVFAFWQLEKIYDQRLEYFKQFWNLLEFVNLLMSIAAVTFYVGRHIVSKVMVENITKADPKGDDFYNFQTVALWDEAFGYLVSFVVFLSTLQLLRLLRFNRRMQILGATLRTASSDLAAFALFFFLVFAAFVGFSYVMFGRILANYRTLVMTMESLIVVSLGDFNYQALNYVNRVFAPIFLFGYMLFIVFILINLMVTILMDGFSEVKDDLAKLPNEHELLDYMYDKTVNRLWTLGLFRRFWALVNRLGIVSNDAPQSMMPTSSVITTTAVPTKRRVRPRLRSRYRTKDQYNVALLKMRLDMLANKLDDIGMSFSRPLNCCFPPVPAPKIYVIPEQVEESDPSIDDDSVKGEERTETLVSELARAQYQSPLPCTELARAQYQSPLPCTPLSYKSTKSNRQVRLDFS